MFLSNLQIFLCSFREVCYKQIWYAEESDWKGRQLKFKLNTSDRPKFQVHVENPHPFSCISRLSRKRTPFKRMQSLQRTVQRDGRSLLRDWSGFESRERDARALYESRTTQKFGACDHFQPRGSFATHTSRSIRNTTRLQACATDSLGFFVATRGCLPQSVPILYHFGLRHGNEAYLYSGAHHVLEPAVGWVDQCCWCFAQKEEPAARRS